MEIRAELQITIIEYAGIYLNGILFSETGQKSIDQEMDWISPITQLYDGKTGLDHYFGQCVEGRLG
jgi:hypothetical protein